MLLLIILTHFIYNITAYTNLRSNLCSRAQQYYADSSSANVQTYLKGYTLNVAVNPSLYMYVNKTTGKPYGGYSYGKRYTKFPLSSHLLDFGELSFLCNQ